MCFEDLVACILGYFRWCGFKFVLWFVFVWFVLGFGKSVGLVFCFFLERY